MAITKNALIRNQTLDRCFRNPGKRYFIQDLLEEVNYTLLNNNVETSCIQKRQLYDDIRFMESAEGWNIPLEKNKEGRTIYFMYADEISQPTYQGIGGRVDKSCYVRTSTLQRASPV